MDFATRDSYRHAVEKMAKNSRLSEWDIAAGHALVLAAGGAVTTIDGQTMIYGRPGFRAPPFIAWGQGSRPTEFAPGPHDP
jgi:3'(2'), 5'-bisphosphate nucleotidase